jgi:mannose-6-phosphate isomerase
MPVFRLACRCQNYPWGKLGQTSLVARYAQSNPGFIIDESKPYAELWMGTHPAAASMVISDDLTGSASISLLQLIQTQPTLLGWQYPDLPFLFKVLSIRTALSIQAHPDKTLARQIHLQRPDLYPDANHKPELAIALTPFEALCGFRPLEEIIGFIKSVPEFRTVLGKVAEELLVTDVTTNHSAQMKQLFVALMTASANIVKEQLTVLVQRLGNLKVQPSQLNELVIRLNSQFPGDVGCFCVYFLNYFYLESGQAIFIATNQPHAYLSGDCIECMATSDNVVRAGLTTKYRDVALLIDMLDYNWSSNDVKLKILNSTTVLYHAPTEFAVWRIQLPANQSSEFESTQASIIIITEGDGELIMPTEAGAISVQSGQVYFIAASTIILIKATTEITIFRAFTGLSN